MKKKRGLLVIIIAICFIIVGLIIFYINLSDKKVALDKLLQSETLLEVNYGIIERKTVLKEKNALFKKVYKDNYTYLHLTNDNILFTYYLDWYYSFDPMQGYHKDFEKKLDQKTVDIIINQVSQKAVDNLKYKSEFNYLVISLNGDQKYIEKSELQYILQENNIELPLYSIN